MELTRAKPRARAGTEAIGAHAASRDGSGSSEALHSTLARTVYFGTRKESLVFVSDSEANIFAPSTKRGRRSKREFIVSLLRGAVNDCAVVVVVVVLVGICV